MVRETRGKILTDMAENKSPEVSPNDIVSKSVTGSVQNLIGDLRGGGRKRNKGIAKVPSVKKRKKSKRARII